MCMIVTAGRDQAARQWAAFCEVEPDRLAALDRARTGIAYRIAQDVADGRSPETSPLLADAAAAYMLLTGLLRRVTDARLDRLGIARVAERDDA